MIIKKRSQKKAGFTLFEMLIIILVLAILTLVGVLNIPPQIAKARDAKRKADLAKIRNALITYHTIKDSFPDSLPDCGQPLSLASSQLIVFFPCDPKDHTSYFYQKEDNQFKIYTTLENKKDAIIKTIGCDHGCGPDCQYNYGTSSTNTFIDRCLPPDLIYACSPGGGEEGHCDQYDDPEGSYCPRIYTNDPSCQNQCGDPLNRCENASGKHIPEE